MSDHVSIAGPNYGPIANGHQAYASQKDVTIRPAADDAFAAALATLRQLTERHAGEIPEASRVRKDLDAIGSEAKDESPDRRAMGDTVLRIIERVGMVKPALDAAEHLGKIVEGLFR